jgi:hypothetical protein
VIDITTLAFRVFRRCPSDRAWQRCYEFGDHLRIEVSAPTREDCFPSYNRVELAVGYAPSRLRFSLRLIMVDVFWLHYRRADPCD